MKIEQITYLCDCCRKTLTNEEIKFATSEQNSIHIISITYDVWYGGVFKIRDICTDCRSKIVKFLKNENMLRGQKQ